MLLRVLNNRVGVRGEGPAWVHGDAEPLARCGQTHALVEVGVAADGAVVEGGEDHLAAGSAGRHQSSAGLHDDLGPGQGLDHGSRIDREGDAGGHDEVCIDGIDIAYCPVHVGRESARVPLNGVVDDNILGQLEGSACSVEREQT